MTARRKIGKGQKLWEKAKKIIPGGNQLLSKRAELFLPKYWPAYYSKAEGIHVWDLDGNKYADFSIMGVGMPLGYRDKNVDHSVIKMIRRGSLSTLNVPEEVELAELLCRLHPWAGMVRYARGGGEAMSVAVRIARAYTGKETVAFCGYHGWPDWYLATNLSSKNALKDHLLPGLEPRGVPKALAGTVLPFRYNHIEELRTIVKREKKLAAIVMEPIHGILPEPGFLEEARAIATKVGAVFIFDEITIGWRMALGGAHLHFGVNPDIAVFAKAISNGYPMAAIIGKKKIMQAAQDTFISSTFWTEGIGPAAALACIKKMRRVNLPAHLRRIGEAVSTALERASMKYDVPIRKSSLTAFLTFNFEGEDHREAKTLFTQEMLKRGFLASTTFYPSFAHTLADVKSYSVAVDESFKAIADARRKGGILRKLWGPIAHDKFARLN